MVLKQRDTADYLVERCANCGMMNIVPRNKTDGCACANCDGGPLIPLGYGILHSGRSETIHVGVDVDTSQLDKVADLVDSIDDHVERIAARLTHLKGEVMRLDGTDIPGGTRGGTL